MAASPRCRCCRPGAVPPAVPVAQSAPNAGSLPNPANTGLQKGVLQGRPAPTPPGSMPPGMAKPPGRTLGRKAPGATPPPGAGAPPGRTLGRKQPGAPGTGKEQRTPVSGPGGVEEQFGRPPASTSPPVLNNQRPGQRRPGSREELTPTAKGGATDTPTPSQPGTAPPVLNRPTRAPTQPGPPGSRRSGKGTTARPAAPARTQTPPGTEWVGVDTAREDTTAPVLDAPAPPVSGSAVSRLEEVPKHLRGRRATTPARPAAPPGTVPPELTKRQTAGTGTPATGRGDEEQTIVTDEEAFTVETPGGGVLAKQREEDGYRPEPPTALRGN